MDALGLIREHYEEIDADEQNHQGSTSSLSSTISSVDSPPLADAIQSIREIYEKIDPAEQIDPLIRFIENQLRKINTQSEAESSSSQGGIETVRDGAKLIIDTIFSAETKRHSHSDAVEAMASLILKVLDGMQEMHWVLIALSVVAFTVESFTGVCCTDNKCRELLLKIIELAKLAKDVIEHNQQSPNEREKLHNAVVTIEGAIICCDCLKSGNRFWSPTKAAAQLAKTNQQLGKDGGEGEDVFLSHSGKQKNFVRQLHVDLTREHVSCFFDEDDHSLPLGQKFPPLIFKAAETCKTAVVVLSDEFIRSKWPMLELCSFVNAKKTGKNANLRLIPIFFKVTPKELSHMTKDSPEWKMLEDSVVRRREWQDALKEVRSMKGLQLAEDGDEVDCRNKVVKKISCFLRGINPPKLLDFKPVGIEEQVQEVKALLDMEGSQPALAVMIYGFGGVGKTTLAASVFQTMDWSSTSFKFCRVIIDDKTEDKSSHIRKLQKNILYDLGGVEPYLRDPEDGLDKIKKVLEKTCSLLFIDNVLHKDYIQYLLPKNLRTDEQGTKLRIIITSRERNVKPELNIICKEYQVKCLGNAASKSLLVETILQSQVVKDIDMNEERMINEVAAACRGVPLLLCVFGKHLRMERNKDSYQEALGVLREGDLDSYRDEDLGKKLMYVYNKIKDVECKEAFLDICTYFHGWKWNFVADIMDFHKLEDLHRRALVSKSGSDEVIVHDILRLVGMKEARLTRFSNYKELSVALEDNLDVLPNVKGISLGNSFITIKSTQLEAMHKSLRVLILGDWVTLDGPPSHRAFRNLRYLSVGDITAFPFKDPSKLDKLRVFLNKSRPGMNLSNLPSGLKRISHEVPYVESKEFTKLPIQNLSLLKSLIVKTQKSVELPEELHLPASLVDVYLSRCNNLPKDLGHLTALESLILDRSDLEFLPQGFGKLQKLKHLSMDSCSKLTFLSEELGNISSLEALSIEDCGKLKALPESLGELRIHKLKLRSLVDLQKLPNSFGNMALLKYLKLESCHSLMSLPHSFVRLTSLEELHLVSLMLKRIPDGFGKLKRLRFLFLEECLQLKTLSDDFENMTTVERLRIRKCPELEGPMMEKILKLQNCSMVDIKDSTKLVNKWQQLKRERETEIRSMGLKGCRGDQLELEYPITVFCGNELIDGEDENHAITVALLDGKCLELDNTTGELIERSSLLEGLAEGRSAMVALIVLPVQKQSHQHQTLQRFVETARKLSLANINGLGKLQIVCARKCVWTAGMVWPTPTKEEEEEDDICEILKSLPKESCVIPSTEFHRLNIITSCCATYDSADKSDFLMGYGVVHKRYTEVPMRHTEVPMRSSEVPMQASEGIYVSMRLCLTVEDFEFVDEEHILKGRKSFENFEIVEEDKTSQVVRLETVVTNIQNFIRSICSVSFWEDDVAGESKTKQFIETLKGNGIDYLLVEGQQLMVDDLLGKTIGFIICNFKHFEFINLQQIFKDLQEKDSNFIAIWIPIQWYEDFGLATYTRHTHCRPWATFPHQLVKVLRGHPPRTPRFVVLDKEGQIANKDALGSLLAWGVKLYPFTEFTYPENFFLMESQSCLEFLLHGMDIVGRMPMKNKMTFLYAQYPGELEKKWELDMKYKLEELIKINGNFEVLYVGRFHEKDLSDQYIENLKQDYEDATQKMPWPSLSFSDTIMFWYRCKETPHKLGNTLWGYHRSLVLVDNHGTVTCRGNDVLQMICMSSNEISNGEEIVMRIVKDELMKSLSRGKCSKIIKTFFADEIVNHPRHPQHPIWHARNDRFTCGVCNVENNGDDWNPQMSYRCCKCQWDLCGICGMAYCKRQVQHLLKRFLK